MPDAFQEKEKAKSQNESDSPPNVVEYDAVMLPDMLPVYYKRLFPHMPFFRWLSYGDKGDLFKHREISFTLHDDLYLRYLSFDTQNEFEKEICSRNPHKIDIGAVMNNRPQSHRSSSSVLQPVQRELVFDIDLTDYDNVRTCCSGAGICKKCWKFMALASSILDVALREDFGFEHILWVFSGRRGVHCWVCDNSARVLNSAARSAIAEYLQLSMQINVNGKIVSRVQLNDRLHHSVRRSLRYIEPMFGEIILDDQNCFGSANGLTYLGAMIPDDIVRKEVLSYLQKNNKPHASSRSIWTSFERYAASMRTGVASSTTSNIWNRKLKYIVEEIQLAMLYPRLDINVTKGFNHLLKAPFCIHPATGKVCLPFNPRAAAKFDPTTVPNISQLLQEINVFDDKSNKIPQNPTDKSRIKDYKKTSMFKGVVVFEEFLRKLESCNKNIAAENNECMEF